MLSIEGIYKNGEVFLEEKPEISRPVKVIVTFLENPGKNSEADKLDLNSFSFNECRDILKDYRGSLSDAVIEERRESL
ncbi:MAG: hypothetical protein ABRQ37_08440 [Candidatus Eremiobacterota bacterium]